LESDGPRAGEAPTWQWAAAWLGLAIATALALYRLRDFPYHLDWVGAWRAVWPLVPLTAWTAAKVWIFWALGAVVIGGWLLHFDPTIEVKDAILAGAAGLWIVAYVAGNVLGPLGLWRTITIWLALVAAGLFLARNPPPVRFSAPSSGQKYALLAWALLAVSMLPLQLGSPVPPFMDVLNHPAAAQRIVTFHRYLPFDNDPYGAYGAHVQAPALELFYATLAFGSASHLATLAETAAMLPMAGLIIFATYRLGRTLFGDTAGGIAALLLFFTNVFRREQGMRATAVVFALAFLGLAFVLDEKRNRTLFAFGAIALGTAVAAHAIGGALAMLVAAGAGLLWLVSGDVTGFVAMLIALVGAALVALPEVLIAEQRSVPYPILPLLILAGIALTVTGASRLKPQMNENRLLEWLGVGLVALVFVVIWYRHEINDSMLDSIAPLMPLLVAFAAAGMIAAAIGSWGSERLPNLGALAIVFLIALAAEFANLWLEAVVATPVTRHMLSDFMSKLGDYWVPYFFVFPAGYGLALVHERIPRPLVFFAVMTMLIYPWHQRGNPQDYDSDEHSIAEQWGFNLGRAEYGYWIGTGDGRWTMNPDGLALVGVLQREVQAGRITPATHILHLTDTTLGWGLAQVTIFTGIDDDPVDYHYDPNNLFEAGSRVHGLADLPAALARKPSYILEQVQPPRGLGDPPAGYVEIFNRGDYRLYRRADIGETTSG
jgi:hypothetical protein